MRPTKAGLYTRNMRISYQLPFNCKQLPKANRVDSLKTTATSTKPTGKDSTIEMVRPNDPFWGHVEKMAEEKNEVEILARDIEEVLMESESSDEVESKSPAELIQFVETGSSVEGNVADAHETGGTALPVMDLVGQSIEKDWQEIYDSAKENDDLIYFMLPPIAKKDTNKEVRLYNCNIGERGDFLALPEGIQKLVIAKCLDARNLCNVQATGLKSFVISECHGVEFLFTLSSFSTDIVKSVETLRLYWLKNLLALFGREGTALQPFPSIAEEVTILSCPAKINSKNPVVSKRNGGS
uniref:C-CAP/cofactor C-like domain-containing protein n=1 Tax=Populus alba TaxID=43335 RepID=A0A4V6ACN9_POPAL|nr:hypothetical protein D5086_0000006690 [Populus alba]